MTNHAKPLPREIASRLARLRFYIRAYVCVRGAALTLATVVGMFWITLALDWLMEPSASVRLLMLVVAGLTAAAVAVREVLQFVLVPLTDANMALLLERRDQRLDDRLLTVVELAGRQPGDLGHDASMLAHTGAEVREMMRGVRPLSVLRFRPLGWSLALLLLAGLSVLLLGAVRPAAVSTWVDRSLLLGPQRWERDTRILVDGFPADARGRRAVKVAIGGDLEVRARADAARRIPNLLELSYVTQDGTRLKHNMTMQGSAVPGQDAFQEYFFQFKNVQNAIRFDVRAPRQQILGKDDVVDGLWIDAVESPDLSDLTLRCKYPAYLQRSDETLPVTGVMSIPEGTVVAVDARATKNLVSADCQISGSSTPKRTIDVKDRGSRFTFELGAVRSDTIVLLTLHDTDGVSNRQPKGLHLRVIADQAPALDVRFAGIGKAITPQALMPLRGSIADDHKLAKTWFEFQSSTEKTSDAQEFTPPADGQLTKQAGVGLDVTDLGLKPGTRFYVWVKAADACPLDAAPHVGTTPRFELDVVTEQQLRAIAEGTETVLRRRLEGVVTDLKRMRDSLQRIETESGTGTAQKSSTIESPVARPAAASPTIESRSAIRVEDALQRTSWATHETLEVADQIERMLEELENNRVQHLDKARSRLSDGIATPLRATATREFPRLKGRLQTLQGKLAEDAGRREAAAGAQKQLDVILRQMDQVLAKMVESEGMNIVVAQLREIIEASDKVGRLMRERQQQLKKELRKGLESDTEGAGE